MYIDRRKETVTFTEELVDTGYVADFIQKLIMIAKRPAYAGATLETTYNSIAIYVSAESSIAAVEAHYKKAKNGGMVRA